MPINPYIYEDIIFCFYTFGEEASERASELRGTQVEIHPGVIWAVTYMALASAAMSPMLCGFFWFCLGRSRLPGHFLKGLGIF